MTVGRRQAADGKSARRTLADAQSGDVDAAMRYLRDFAARHGASLESAPGDVCEAVVERLAAEAGENLLPATDCALVVTGLADLADDDRPETSTMIVDEIIRGRVEQRLTFALPALVDAKPEEVKAHVRDVYLNELSECLGAMLAEHGDQAVSQVDPLLYKNATRRLREAEIDKPIGALVGRRRWAGLVRETLDRFDRFVKEPEDAMMVDAEFYSDLVGCIREVVDRATGVRRRGPGRGGSQDPAPPHPPEL